MSKPNETLKHYWRSVSQRKTRLAVLGNGGASEQEFPPGADELVVEGGASRRKFMGLLGASTALAGLTSTGCVRKPVEKIMPFAKRPEDRIPGMPEYYATAHQVGSTVQGVLVESHDGRPTKIEGNPQHSGSQGGTDAWTQASVLNLYDPERSKQVRSKVLSAHIVGGEQPREQVKARMCQTIHDRTLERSKSVDAAEAAVAACEKTIEASGIWNETVAPDGRTITELIIDWDEQLETSWDDARVHLNTHFGKFLAEGGEGLALVVSDSMSPSLRAMQQAFMLAYPKAKIAISDPTYPVNAVNAAERVAGPGARSYHSLDGAKIILSVDSDFMGSEQDHVRLTREFTQGRKVTGPEDAEQMNRLYVVEPHLTTTGAMADNRLRLAAGDCVDFLAALVIELLGKHGMTLPPSAASLASAIRTRGQFDDKTQRYIAAVAKDLADRVNKPNAGPGRVRPDPVAVLVGERQPELAHGLGFLLNVMLRAATTQPPGSLRFVQRLDALPTVSLTELAAGLEDKSIRAVVCLGSNPVYDTPGRLGLAEKLAAAELLVHAGTHHDETGQIAHWHLPTSHYLESWGDLEAADGTTTIQQPLIAPLHDTRSLLEIMALVVPEVGPEGEPLLSTVERSGAELVREHWTKLIAAASDGKQELSDQVWNSWLHDGVVSGIPRSPTLMRPNNWGTFAPLLTAREFDDSAAYEINFHLDPKVLAGEYSNNAWMQEVPHPISKLTWDNAAYISKRLAAELGVENGQNLSISVAGVSLSIPAWIAPGQHDRTVSLSLGYGRHKLGSVAEGAGFDVNVLRGSETEWFVRGDVGRGAGEYDLVSTQDYGSLDPDGPDGTPILNFERRPIYRETDVAGFKRDPEFAKKGDLMPPERLKSPWTRFSQEERPTLSEPIMTGPHQWGMSIDLNTCTGCNACVVACQAENNIPVVGKKEVGNGREMHWIRLDRYYVGSEDDPEAVIMPVACQHCETAPCENVCPVQATAHSPEGLNDMAYNRCIGTRYCANNCPYKVRRFNFFNYNRDIPLEEQMQKNPDVTVRFRGVIEKCTYCVQRISEAKIQAHVDGRDKVRDGEVITACQQVCGADSIVFGDLTDPDSAVSQLKYSNRAEDYSKREPSLRDYGLLTDLNTKPRTTFLARVRNPNPELA